MELNELQKKLDEWIKLNGVRYYNELTNMAILTEEVGELARIIARKYGEQSYKESDKNLNLEEEIADILFVLTCIANQTGINLEKAVIKNFEKINKRDLERHKNNEKINNKNGKLKEI